jgi:SsrA-binding protein
MKVVNRKALHDYQIIDKFEAGIKLQGHEVKSVKNGRIKLRGSFVKIIDEEAWLVNAHIPLYDFATDEDYQPTRSRKLLLHKREILGLKQALEKGGNLTIVPLACYTSGNKVKIRIGLAKGKKQWDKRRKIKERELKRKKKKRLKQFR